MFTRSAWTYMEYITNLVLSSLLFRVGTNKRTTTSSVVINAGKDTRQLLVKSAVKLSLKPWAFIVDCADVIKDGPEAGVAWVPDENFKLTKVSWSNFKQVGGESACTTSKTCSIWWPDNRHIIKYVCSNILFISVVCCCKLYNIVSTTVHSLTFSLVYDAFSTISIQWSTIILGATYNVTSRIW